MRDQQPKPDDKEPKNESGRVSRSGTSAGISEGSDATSGGNGPIKPGGDGPISRDELERERNK
jgi:hypothetical protein